MPDFKPDSPPKDPHGAVSGASRSMDGTRSIHSGVHQIFRGNQRHALAAPVLGGQLNPHREAQGRRRWQFKLNFALGIGFTDKTVSSEMDIGTPS